MTQLIQTLTDGIAVGALYALIALGYTLVYGILKFINFAHSDIFALGAWLSFAIASMFGLSAASGTAPPWYLGLAVLLCAMIGCGVAGFLIERFAYRPLRGAPRLNVLITAIGVSLLLQNIGQLNTKFTFGPYPKAMPALLPDRVLTTIAGVNIRLVDGVVLGTALLLMIGIQWLVFHTRIGTAMRAVSFNHQIAALMGINVDAVVSMTFVLGSVFAAAAGFLYAMKYPQLNQTASAIWVLLGLKAFVAAVVGGIGNIRGAMLGGIFIGLIEFFGVAYLSDKYRDVYVFSLLIIVLLVRPSGLLGTATVEKVSVSESIAELRPPIWTTPLRAIGPLVAGAVVALVLYELIGPALGGFGSNLLLFAGINIVLAVSLTIVNGFTGQFSIGHAGFMALGGYTAAAIVYYGSFKLFGDGNFHGGSLSWTGRAGGFSGPLLARGDLLFVAACLAGGLVAAIAGWIVGLPSLRLRGDYLAIVTLGFGEIVRVVLQGTEQQLRRSQGDEILAASPFHLLNKLGGALGFISIPTYTTVFWVYLWVAIMLVVAIRLKYSSYGRALLSIREDEIAAQAVGVNITSYKVRAFVFSSFFAGVAGALYALQIGSINAGELGFQRSFEILIMVVLGGLGSVSGAALAAIILTLLPEFLRFVEQYRMIVYSLLLILMMIFRPQGLFGVREVWDLFWPKIRARFAR